jgi:uncharacterized protein YciI
MLRTKLIGWTFAAILALAAPFPALAAPPAAPPVAQATPQLYVFTYRPGPAWRAGVPMKQQGLGPHGTYMQSLLDAGRLFAAGGFVDADGGMAIIYAATIDEARTMLAADPAISSGIFTAEIRHWRPRFRASGPLPE